MTTEQALTRLIESTVEAVSGVLEAVCPGVEVGGVSVGGGDLDPLGALPPPIVASSVSYVNGVSGGNLFAMPLEGAQALAAAMTGDEPPSGDATGLTDLERSAIAEAMNQMMAAGALATGAVLGEEVEIGPPEVGVYAGSEEAMAAHDQVPHQARAQLTVAGAPARLVQLVPSAFVVRMTRALDERRGEQMDPRAGGPLDAAGAARLAESLRDVPVRLWAELGRARMQTGRLVGLPPGAVVELDRRADDPVDIFVNGLPFATGRLIVVDGDEWAVRVDAMAPGAADLHGGGAVA